MKKIEQIRRLMDGTRSPSPASETLGMKVVAVEEGEVSVEMPVTEEILNRGGGVAGGFIAALSDFAMALSLGTVSDEDESHATIEFKFNFVRPAPPELSPLTATGRLLHRTRRVGHVEGDVRGSDGSLIAKATSTWSIKKSGFGSDERD